MDQGTMGERTMGDQRTSGPGGQDEGTRGQGDKMTRDKGTTGPGDQVTGQGDQGTRG